MNKIFKVIWSKSKQCYVVVSEMAKNKTGKKKIVVASILAALAIQTAGVIDVAAAAGDQPSTAIANGRVASGKTNGLAIGNFASSNSHQSIAIGYYSVATAAEANPALPATAVGAGANATGQSTVALGLSAQATSGSATALGAKSVASEDAAVAVGHGAQATGGYASALGADAIASNNDSTAFGHGTKASGASSTALGSRAKAGSVAGVGIGMLANATNQYGIAIGGESSSSSDNSIAIGRKSSVTGDNGIAIGAFTSSKGTNGVAVGTNSTTSDQGGVAVGNAAKSKQLNATAIGINVTADAANSVALGGSATASSDGTIAIGSYGSTKTTATGNRALAIGSATTANGLESIAIGSRVNSGSQHSIAIGTGSNASAVRSIALGPDSRATVESGVALGAGSVADRAGGIANKGYNPNDNRTNKYAGLNNWALSPSTGAVAVGNGSAATRQITGLAAGKEDTDAVNVAQLKSVNLAFAGNVGSGDVNLANSMLGLKGDNTYITTSANGQNLTISGKTQNINVTNGQASAPAAGMADAKNVADSINKAISANAYNWKLAADNDNGRSEVINKEDTVSFSGDNNITVARNGKKITTSLNKAITVDTVKANKSVTVSSGGNQITLDGSNGAVTGKTFSGQSFTAGNNVLSNTTLQIGPTTGNNVTITTDGLAGKAGSKTVKFGTNGISAGGQQITDVSSGGNVGTNAANITDVKNAVSDVTLKLDTNSKTGTVKLSESPLKVIGANGIRTDLVGTNNGSLVVGLDNNTINATTKGIGLTGDTGSTGLKYLKDGDATFKVAGDGNLVTTKASATGVQVAVDATKVKDLAVGAVTVSKANTADNPITITPTAGTNTKDYAIGIDTTKLADQTQLTYKANGANPNKVSLANGLNFTNGTFTTATVGANGNVTISTATETITNDADGKAKVNSPTDGLATAKNVADSINKAVDGLSQNLTVSDGTTDGTVKLKNEKLTVAGANGVTTTVNGQTVTVGLDTDTKTKIDASATAVNRNVSLGADSGTVSSQSLKDGDVAFNVKGATGDFVSTKMNGNTVEVSTKRAAINSDANSGAASVTGDDGLATSKNVADAINKAADAAKAGAAWNLSANGDTGTKVSGGDTVDFTGDNNITVTQTGKNIATTLNKDLKDLSTISLTNPRGETIFLNGRDGSIKANKAEFKDNVGAGSTITSDQLRITNGATGANEATTTLALGALSIQAGPNSTALDSKYLMFSDEDGNNAEGSAKGMAFQDAAGKMVHFSLDEIKAGGNKIQEVAEGTADTDAVNVKQLKDTVASQTLTYRANTAADADAKTVKLSKGLDFVDGTMTKATVDNDGKVTFDINDDTKAKINDSAAAVNRKVSLGADSGTVSSQSLKDGDVAFNVKGATGDFISTKMNGDTVEVSTKRATIDSNATTGTASVTGDDGLATAKNVADAINKAASQAKDGAAWKLSANGDTPTTVAGGDTVDFTGDNNITVTQTGKNIATTLNKDLKKLNSISLENGVGETIKFDAINASGKFGDPAVGNYTQIDRDGIRINNGIDVNQPNTANTYLDVGSLSLQAGPNSSSLDSKNLIFNDEDGNLAQGSAQGMAFQSAAGKTIQFTLDEINAGGNKIQEVAEGTADTDAVNVKQLKDTVASQTLTYRANTAADTDAKTVKLSKGLDFVDGTMTKATVDNDGKVTFDINDDTKAKINDSAAAVNRKVSLGADSGTVSSQSLKDGDVAFNVKGATGDFVSTKMNGNTVEISTKRATIDSNATTGAASVTGDDGLATAKNVADAINKAASQAKDGAAWNLSTNGDAGTKVSGGDTVDFTGDNNITVTQTGKNIATTLNKDLKKMNTISFEDGLGETIKFDAADSSGTFRSSRDAAYTKINHESLSIKNGETGANGVETFLGLDILHLHSGSYDNNLTSRLLAFHDANGNESIHDAQGIIAESAGGAKTIQFTLDEIKAGGNKIQEVAEGTADTDAVNVKQLKDTVASQTLTYRANTAADADAKTVKLSKGLDFVDGTMTKATVDNDGKVTFDINDDTKTKINDSAAAVNRKVSLGADSGTVSSQSLKDGDVAFNVKGASGDFVSTKMNGDTVEVSTKRATIDSNATTGAASVTGDDGLATAKNVADAINAAKKSSKTEITANDGEAADGTTGNVVLTSSKAADGHTIYDVKLNDKVVLGTGANAVTIDGTTGTITGKTANIGGVTVDGATNHVTGLGNTTWNGNAVSGRAATEDQLKAVADAAASQTWQITADKDAATSGIQTGTKKDAKVGKDAKVKMIAGENITINQNELDFTYSLNKDLVNMNSASFNGTGGNTTVINGDSITQTAGTQTNTSTAAGNTVADGAKSTATTAAGTTITDGAKTNTSTADSTVIDDGNGNNTALTKDGVTITTTGKDKVSLTGNGLDNGNNKIVNVADGTNDTDAVNVRQLEAKTKASTTELTANGGESAGSTTGNIVLTKTTAADGHIIYDNKLNDKVTLGTDPTKAVTVDGTNGTIKAGKDGNAVAINGTDGTIKAGDGTNAVAIDGKNGSVKAGDKIALDGKDGKATIGTVGIDGKDGVISGLANKTWDPNNITPGRAATEDQVKSAVADAGWDAAVGTEGSGVNSTPSATAEKVKPNETLTFKAGNNMMVSQNGKSISYAVNPELKDMKSATFKDADGNTTVTNGNGMTITRGSANPNNPKAGPVSLTKDGLNNGNNQLKGIAPGTADTDAVNVGQLKASNAKIGDAIGQVAGEVQRVGAHAAAMAALKPIQYDPLEPTQVMAGVGNYRGETAAALGLAHYTNEDTMFNVGVSLGANRNMVNAGVTHKFGSSPEKKNIPDRYKAGPISSVYVMQDEVSSLKKENSEQKTVIADQAARLNTLEAENERQRQELAETKQGLEDLRAAVNQLLASKG
ncbi:ESPR-type extended signal peptide-containing protein [uncultured Veillonella sp.]|uniref:ESPR-type extended signal peptide-containing protein n=1 Tax=uncultured Veillonella sp. TaxID=159268 RepID=UPI00280479F2|nr:ESPR-type extended signal peptide-containing protein [uncultured Veillonella sp.]